jgi:hypothetical protein
MRTAERFFAAKTLDLESSSDPAPPNSLPMAETRRLAGRARGRAGPRARADNAPREADDRATTPPSLPGAAHGIGLDAVARARLAKGARPPGSAGLGAWHARRITEVAASSESIATISASTNYRWQRVIRRFGDSQSDRELAPNPEKSRFSVTAVSASS